MDESKLKKIADIKNEYGEKYEVFTDDVGRRRWFKGSETDGELLEFVGAGLSRDMFDRDLFVLNNNEIKAIADTLEYDKV